MALRAQLKSVMKVREAREAKATVPRKTRAASRLEKCPGVSAPSLSGKRMRPLPAIWQENRAKNLKANAEPENLDSTFSFSEEDYQTGKTIPR